MRTPPLLVALAASAVLGGGASAAALGQQDEQVRGHLVVELELELDRYEARVGDTVTAALTWRHTGGGPVTVHCGSGSGLLLQQGIGPAGPARMTGKLAAFREVALQSRLEAEQLPVPDCTSFRVESGEVRVRRVPVVLSSRNGSQYAGPVTLELLSEYSWSEADDAPTLEFPRSHPATVHLDGGDPARLTPARAVDAALAHPGFARAVLASDPSLWQSTADMPIIGRGLDAPYGISVVTRSREGGRTLSGVMAEVESPTQVRLVERAATID